MSVLATSLAASASASGSGILCTLLLIAVVIFSVLVLIAVVQNSRRSVSRSGYGYLADPAVPAVVAWVLYLVLC